MLAANSYAEKVNSYSGEIWGRNCRGGEVFPRLPRPPRLGLLPRGRIKGAAP